VSGLVFASECEWKSGNEAQRPLQITELRAFACSLARRSPKQGAIYLYLPPPVNRGRRCEKMVQGILMACNNFHLRPSFWGSLCDKQGPRLLGLLPVARQPFDQTSILCSCSGCLQSAARSTFNVLLISAAPKLCTGAAQTEDRRPAGRQARRGGPQNGWGPSQAPNCAHLHSPDHGDTKALSRFHSKRHTARQTDR